jgi:dolichyl-phosphate beta-glucosyltransferase
MVPGMLTVRGHADSVRVDDAQLNGAHLQVAPGSRPESPRRVIDLSYVVPACNSAATIEATLQTLAAELDGRAVEIVVVQNGSTDATSELLAQAQKTWRHLRVPLRVIDSEPGLGHAYRTGIAVSRGERIVLTADDLPFGFDDLDAADALDVAAHPIVIGSKGHRESVVERGGLRRVLSAGFWLLRRAILGMRTLDPQGTFILAGTWARQVVDQLSEPGYLVTTELCYLAERSGLQPVEVPVRLSDAHGAHRSRVKPLDVWRMGAGLIGIRRRHKDSRGAQVVRRLPLPVGAVEEAAA